MLKDSDGFSKEELKGIIEEQAKLLLQLQEEKETMELELKQLNREKDVLLIEKECAAKEQKYLNQKILTSIYNSLCENKLDDMTETKNGERDNGRKYSQEEISNFCMYIASRFGLKDEPYRMESFPQPKSSPKKDPRSRKDSMKSRLPLNLSDEFPNSHDHVPLSAREHHSERRKNNDGHKDAPEKSHSSHSSHSYSKKGTKPGHYSDRPMDHSKALERNSQTLSERRSKGSSQRTVDEVFSFHEHSKDKKKMHMSIQTRHTTDSITSEGEPLVFENFHYFLEDQLILSVPYHPNKNCYKMVSKICLKQNWDLDSVVFKDKKGESVNIQPATLCKEISDKKIIFALKDKNDKTLTLLPINTAEYTMSKKKVTKNHSADDHRETKSKFKDIRKESRNKDGQGLKTSLESLEQVRRTSAPVKSTPIRTRIDINEIRVDTVKAWSNSFQNSPLFGDLCRLSSRISFTDNRTKHTPINYSPPEGLTGIQYAKKILTLLVQALETKELNKKTMNIIEEADNAADGALWLESVFETLGPETKVGKFLMAVHQGIITPAANQLKVVLFSNTTIFPKDVQGKDGWRIELVLSDQQVLISHSRKEVSVKADVFSFEWKLMISLNPNFQSVDNINLVVSNLKTGKNCDPALKQKIQECLIDQIKS